MSDGGGTELDTGGSLQFDSLSRAVLSSVCDVVAKPRPSQPLLSQQLLSHPLLTPQLHLLSQQLLLWRAASLGTKLSATSLIVCGSCSTQTIVSGNTADVVDEVSTVEKRRCV